MGNSKGQNVGYIRVSSIGQNTDRQLDGVPLDKSFTEKVSGKSLKRPKLKECLDFLREGDTLHIHSMDRLARNLKDLQGIVEQLIEKGIIIHFHKENLIFSGKSDHISKLMLQIMGAVAEFERSLIKERQAEGIAIAKKKGIMGRPAALSPEELTDLKDRVASGENKSVVAKNFNISRQTLYRLIKE